MTRPLNIQLGHIARHTPPTAGAQGREAAIVDIAQDLLLRDLAYEGILDTLAFKGVQGISMWRTSAHCPCLYQRQQNSLRPFVRTTPFSLILTLTSRSSLMLTKLTGLSFYACLPIYREVV